MTVRSPRVRPDAPRWAGQRRVLALCAALVAVVLSIAPPVARPVAAAAPELQITAAARYDVQPERARVHVTLETTISNRHRDTGTTQTYFDTAFLAVLPGTENFAATSSGAKPTVSVRTRTRSYTLLTIKLGRRLFAGRHTALQLQFDLPDRGGTALRDVRVGTTLVAFPVWAFATEDTPGSSVTVTFPAGYNVQQQLGSLPDPSDGPGGTQVYSSGLLDAPLSFYSYFVADRPGAFAETRSTAAVGASSVPLVVRAWTDDPAWGTRVGSLVRRALPALSTAIGLPFTGTGLVVQETVSRSLGGYAGLFDPVAATIQVAYYAEAFVVLHESAHAWFNGKLASDRWILEAFASWYASQAAAALKVSAQPPTLTPDLQAAAIPLNAWPPVGRADEATEDYAYAATYTLAAAIAARAKPAGLREVWQAAANGEFAYQPFRAGAAVERGAPPPDWRGFLDLLEARTSSSYADLWTKWVVRPTEGHLLDERATARTAYASAVVAAGAWELPPNVRRAMSAWQFGQAGQLIRESRAVLQQRASIASAAGAAGLTVPAALQAAFEGTDGPAAAASEASRELDTIEIITTAAAAAQKSVGLFAQIGLLGLAPDAELTAARTAFGAGNMASAQSLATSARTIWANAEGRGQERFVTIIVAIIVVLVLLVAAGLVVRTHRARRQEQWP